MEPAMGAASYKKKFRAITRPELNKSPGYGLLNKSSNLATMNWTKLLNNTFRHLDV